MDRKRYAKVDDNSDTEQDDDITPLKVSLKRL
jgi:hypothetical protein